MNKTYEAGLRDGKISALEETQNNHKSRLDSHSRRLATMEKMIYIGVGGLLLINGFPLIKLFLEMLAK